MNQSTFMNRLPLTAVTLAGSLALGGIFFLLMKYNLRYSAYLIVFMVVFCFFAFAKMPVLKVSIVLFSLVFVENILVYNRNVADYVIVGISLVFAVLLIASSFRNFHRLSSPYFQRYCWLFFLGVAFLTIFTTEGLTYDLFLHQLYIFQMKYFEFFLFFLMGFLAFDEIEDADRFLKVMILLGALVAFSHIYALLTGFNLEAVRGAEAVTRGRDLTDDKNWRYGGVFGNPNYMAVLYVMVVPVCLIVFSKMRQWGYKILCMAALVLILLSVTLTGSRGGIVFMLANILLLFVYYRASFMTMAKYLFYLSAILLVSYVIVTLYFPDYLNLSLERMTQKDVSEDIRWAMWWSTLQMIFAHPLGIGIHPDSFGNLLYNKLGVLLGHPHNAFLALMVCNGLVGFLLIARIVFVQLAGVVRRVKDENQSARHGLVHYGLIALLAGFLLASLTNGTFINNHKTNHIFGLVLGVTAFVNHRCLGARADSPS